MQSRCIRRAMSPLPKEKERSSISRKGKQVVHQKKWKKRKRRAGLFSLKRGVLVVYRLRGLADHAVHGFGEVIQVMCVQARHGDTAILGLEGNSVSTGPILDTRGREQSHRRVDSPCKRATYPAESSPASHSTL
jgi:hypothetical protein